MKRVLIAGKDSYIGQSLVRFVESNGLPCETVELDVQDSAWRSFDFSGFDSVVLVAGIAHRKETEDNRHLYYEVNRDLAYEIAKTSKSSGVPHFIMLSTMSVYGMDEGTITLYTPEAPKNAYGESKLEGERLVRSLGDDEFRVAILRPPMVYGPGCKGNFNSLAKLAATSPVFPKIRNERSAIFIDNLCSFLLMCVSESLNGTFFPQDEQYMNTSHAAAVISKAAGKRSYQSCVLGTAVLAVKPFLKVAKKAFGTLTYSGTERNDYSYCMVEQDEALRRSIASYKGAR